MHGGQLSIDHRISDYSKITDYMKVFCIPLVGTGPTNYFPKLRDNIFERIDGTINVPKQFIKKLKIMKS